MEAVLPRLDAISDQQECVTQYVRALDGLILDAQSAGCDPARSVEQFNSCVRHLCSENMALVVSRPVLAHFASNVASVPLAAALRERVLVNALTAIEPRLVSYEECFSTLCELLASVYREDGRWLSAAQTLCRIPLESAMRDVDGALKLRKYIEIAQLFLEAGDPAQAETFISRAAGFVRACSQREILLEYEECYANVLFSKRKYMEACTRFHSLSSAESTHAHSTTSSREKALELSVICAVLSPAGPQRFHILRLLHKDSRTRALETSSLLDALYYSRLLPREHVALVTQTLLPKHATDIVWKDLKQAALEHNILAASAMYKNIFLEDLGCLLDTESREVERTAAKMIFENRMNATIDQVAGVLDFDSPELSANAASLGKARRDTAALDNSANEIEHHEVASNLDSTSVSLLAWDARIAAVCAALDSCIPRAGP